MKETLSREWQVSEGETRGGGSSSEFFLAACRGERASAEEAVVFCVGKWIGRYSADKKESVWEGFFLGGGGRGTDPWLASNYLLGLVP